MRFVLVRHGEVEEAASSLGEGGRDGPPLTPVGRRQAAALAGELNDAAERGVSFAAIFTSPLPAARMTAEAIEAVLDLGAPRRTPELAPPTPGSAAPHGIEALEALQAQAWSLLESLKQAHNSQSSFVLVSHDPTIRSLVCRALSLPLEDMYRFALEPGSLTTIEFRVQPRERILVANLNETCHLEEVAS